MNDELKAVEQILSAMHAAIAVADDAAYRAELKARGRRACGACMKIRLITPASQFQSAPCSRCAAIIAKVEVDRLRAQWKAKNTAHIQLVPLRAVAATGRRVEQELRALEKDLARLVGLAADVKSNAEGSAP